MNNNYFEVQRYGEPSAAFRKYKNTELYLPPPTLFPSEVLDTMDQHYLDSHSASIISPLLKPMQIELYNDKWLQPHGATIQTKSAIVDKPSRELDAIVFEPHANQDMHLCLDLHKETSTRSPTLHPDQFSSNINVGTDSNLHDALIASKDKLSFISYMPKGTMMCRWYIVQVDIDTSSSLY